MSTTTATTGIQTYTTAGRLVSGQTFTDHMGHTHTVVSVDRTAGGTGQGVYVTVDGQGYPEFYTKDTEVTIHRTEHTEHCARMAKESAAELARIKSSGWNAETSTFVIWDEHDGITGNNHRRKYTYTTTKGLHTALLRFFSNPYAYTVVDVF